MKRLAIALALLAPTFGQTAKTADSSALKGTATQDNSGGLHTLPTIVVANVGSLPSTGCKAGELAIVSAATVGQQIYENSGTGSCTWTQQLNSGTPTNGSASNILTSNGSGGFGTPIAPGTGVATALAVNVGSAGAPVVNGGVLGTPSGGTATNVTGLPVATGISGLGTGVATALAVNVGSAGAPVVNGGSLGTPASGTATNITGLPVSTGISGFGTGVAAALAANVSGSGGPCLITSCSMVTPALGTPASGNASNLTNLPITLTTTGSSGASSYTQSTNTLNIPQYTGGGASVPSFNVTVNGGGTVLTMGPGSVLTAANGVTVLAGGPYTITHSSGTDTGSFYVGVNGSNQPFCYYGAGITIGNWAISAFQGGTCTSGTPPANIYMTTMPVVAGVISAAPTQYQPVTNQVITQGSCVTVTNNTTVAYAASAVSPCPAQKFFGTAAPGSVSGNFPGDEYIDTTAHNFYICGAASGTAAPACTSVTAGGWLLVNGGGGGGLKLGGASANGDTDFSACTSGAPCFVSIVGRVQAGQAESEAQAYLGQAETWSYICAAPSYGGAPSGGTTVFTLRKNGADTALTFTIPPSTANTTPTCDSTHSVSFTTGDSVDMKIYESGGTTYLSAHTYLH